jgi:hypothetical protein
MEPWVDESIEDFESRRGGRTCRGCGSEDSGGCGIIWMCCCILCNESGCCCWLYSAEVTWVIEGRRCCEDVCGGEDEADVM